MTGEISINLSNFKLAERLTALKGITKGIIYLSDADNLERVAKLKKKALNEDDDLLSYQLSNNKFQFKVKKFINYQAEVSYKLYTKHPDLPGDKEMWYWVKNWEAFNMVILLGENFDKNEGTFADQENFELVFDNHNNCMILNKDSEEYKKIVLNNTVDSGMFDTMSKTGKRISGNLYLAKGGEKNHYLGDLWRIKNETGEKEKYQVYLENIEETDESVNEVLKKKLIEGNLSVNEGNYNGRTYGYNVKKNWVNLGPKLKPMTDNFDIRDYWEEAVEEYVKQNQKPISKYSEFHSYEYFSCFIKIFTVTCGETTIEEDATKITPRIREVGKDIIKSYYLETLIDNYWAKGDTLPDETRMKYTINQYKDLSKEEIKEKLINELPRIYYFYSYDSSVDRDEFIKMIFEKLFGLNIADIFEETWEKFINMIPFINSNLQNLINWKRRILIWYSPRSRYTLHQLSEYSQNKWSHQEAQHDSFENWPTPDTPKLRNLLLEMYNKAIENSGLGVKQLEINSYNVGKKDQTHVMTCVIAIEDIVDYFGGDIKSVPEEIVKELLEYRLVEFEIKTNNNNFKLDVK